MVQAHEERGAVVGARARAALVHGGVLARAPGDAARRPGHSRETHRW